MGQDETKGYAKLVPDFTSSGQAKPMWLKFNLKSGTDQPVNRIPEVLVELTTFLGPAEQLDVPIEIAPSIASESLSGHVRNPSPEYLCFPKIPFGHVSQGK